MRILLDQNLSPKLISLLADVLPALETVYDHHLVGASDPAIFRWAREQGFVAMVSADRDLVQIVERLGAPPKIIRLERCDFPSRIVARLLRREIIRIHRFLLSDRSILSLAL